MYRRQFSSLRASLPRPRSPVLGTAKPRNRRRKFRSGWFSLLALSSHSGFKFVGSGPRRPRLFVSSIGVRSIKPGVRQLLALLSTTLPFESSGTKREFRISERRTTENRNAKTAFCVIRAVHPAQRSKVGGASSGVLGNQTKAEKENAG